MGSFRSLTQRRALLVLLPVGTLVAVYSGWRVVQERTRLADALPVEAEVLSSRVEDWVSGSGTNRSRQYRPVVNFRYRFDDRVFESDLVTPLGDSGARGWARDLAGRFAAGDRVRAWVDPDEPGTAYLVKLTSWKPIAGLAVGSLIALYAVGGLIWHARRRRSAARGGDA
jgi:hypothetical protein